MKVVHTLELTEKERKVIQDFMYLMNEISDTLQDKSITDVASYFCDNAEWSDGVCEIDKIHQIKEM